MPSTPRQWLASLALELAPRAGTTALVRCEHQGPLRVQRPFYPEGELCHIYWLHPPGGLVLGDELRIQVTACEQSQSLLTTPSAGKIYAVKGAAQQQKTHVNLQLANESCIEWLPQETLVFEGANAELTTRIELSASARFWAWDIVCLGRPAAGEAFTKGQCVQRLEVWREGLPLLIEHNRLVGGSEFLAAPWGLQGGNSLGTCVASVAPSRDQLDALRSQLAELAPAENGHSWGLTQKGELFIARYLGNSASHCRLGFELLWRQLRPLLNNRPACAPRIWAT